MSRMRLASILLVVMCLFTALAAISCSTAETKTAAAEPVDPVARGRYLVAIMSCTDCHTPGHFYGAPDTNRFLSGSEVGWVGPWGVVHARNLTPDSATGIGSWTKEQIMHAIRTGNTPDGTQLAAVMPWMNYANVLTDEDAMAIASYLKSIPPVTHKNLDRVPPGGKPKSAVIVFPPPPAWDVPAPPAQAASGTH